MIDALLKQEEACMYRYATPSEGLGGLHALFAACVFVCGEPVPPMATGIVLWSRDQSKVGRVFISADKLDVSARRARPFDQFGMGGT